MYVCIYVYVYTHIVYKGERGKEKSKREEVEGKGIRVYIQNEWYNMKLFIKPNICKIDMHCGMSQP